MSGQRKNRLGQVRSDQDMSCQDPVRSSQVTLGWIMTMTGPLRTGKVRPREVISGQVRPGQVRTMPVQFRSGQIRIG